jgi:hypothetical protein
LRGLISVESSPEGNLFSAPGLFHSPSPLSRLLAGPGMDKNDLSTDQAEARGLPDTDFVDVLELFEDSNLLEPHHNAELEEVFRSRDGFGGEIIYYAVSDKDEILATFTFLYSKKEWKGDAENYRAEIEINPELFEMIFSEEWFEEAMDFIITPFMVMRPEERSLELEIPAKGNITGSDTIPDMKYREVEINATINVVVDIAKYFRDRIDEKQVTRGLHEYIGVFE